MKQLIRAEPQNLRARRSPAWRGGVWRNAAIRKSSSLCQRSVPVTRSVASARSRSSVQRGADGGERGWEIALAGRHGPKRVERGHARGRDHGADRVKRGARRNGSAGKELACRDAAAVPRVAAGAYQLPSPVWTRSVSPCALRMAPRKKSGAFSGVSSEKGVRPRFRPRATPAAGTARPQVSEGVRPGMESTNLIVNRRAPGRDQSMMPSLFCDLVRVSGRRLVLGSLQRFRRRSGDPPLRTSATAPSCARSRSTSRAVSSSPIGRETVASIGPASSAFTTRMMVTPVSVSPAMTAR